MSLQWVKQEIKRIFHMELIIAYDKLILNIN